MFDLLDTALEAMLGEPSLAAIFPELFNAEVSFVTPEKGHTPTKETVDLFLYETRENRELRDPAPVVTTENGRSIRRRPPLRVDCAYMVTTWSKKTGADKVAAEHRLLGQAFNWLSRFPIIPAGYLQLAGLTGQAFPPPTLVAQMDAAKNAGEFWNALGVAPRPFFNVIVTVAMDLDRATGDPIVTTLTAGYHAGDAASLEERVSIGGTVRDRQGNPLADAWVRLDPQGVTGVTDAKGRFLFQHVARGTGLTLRARAPGLVDAVRAPLEIPSISRDYDLQF